MSACLVPFLLYLPRIISDRVAGTVLVFAGNLSAYLSAYPTPPSNHTEYHPPPFWLG
jgi:hypothetical protein